MVPGLLEMERRGFCFWYFFVFYLVFEGMERDFIKMG